MILKYKDSFIEVSNETINDDENFIEIFEEDDTIDNLEQTRIIKPVSEKLLLEQTLTNLWGQNE
ncbi:MAG: hypothetical protein GX951_01270 [Mollicutes bacterium]|nr:hypothetical protein [Mollicutes bacterium]